MPGRSVSLYDRDRGLAGGAKCRPYDPVPESTQERLSEAEDRGEVGLSCNWSRLRRLRKPWMRGGSAGEPKDQEATLIGENFSIMLKQGSTCILWSSLGWTLLVGVTCFGAMPGQVGRLAHSVSCAAVGPCSCPEPALLPMAKGMRRCCTGWRGDTSPRRGFYKRGCQEKTPLPLRGEGVDL